ncbi:DUF1642 domain-containing protein [Enterococcus faecalis]|uniref:DUF1642 domain-containing protein n=1 Tax=Enterococcus faecalis TaxID=1351 RepID=UPI002362490C|nr:DUF1642 domain-containing protein [Enterococcus faecalis]MDD0850789.1 DUF1642 domain-containing protein [Enterococcus faecalis]
MKFNVQELLGKYKKEYAENVKDYNQAINDRRQELYANIINDLKQLDEPKKAVLPKTADDFIEESLGIGSDKVDIISSADSFSQEIPDDEFYLWFKSNRDLFVDALANGYEVKKEPLYYVKLPEIGYMRFGYRYFYSEDLEEAKKYTEQEIKAIDERYWPFAVKVEEE